MPDRTPSLLALSPEQVRVRKREVMRRRLLQRRLPLLAWERLLQRLAGLMLHHPQQAGFVRELTHRASEVRLQGNLKLADELEAEYLSHLTARGITESWYDPVVDEASLLDRHYRAVGAALEGNKEPSLIVLRQKLFPVPPRPGR